MLVAAKIREKDRDRVYDRKLLKERLEEDKLLGINSEETTKFMTSAYKQKLLEDQKWQYEEKLIEEIDKRTNAENKGMHGFYANLLTKNISMGGNVADNAVSAYTAGSIRQQHVLPTSTYVTNNPLADISGSSTSKETEEKISIAPSKVDAIVNKIGKNIQPTKNLDTSCSDEVKEVKNKAVNAARERYLARKRNAEDAEI